MPSSFGARVILTVTGCVFFAWGSFHFMGAHTICRGSIDSSIIQKSSFQLAFNQSFGYFDDINDSQWEEFYLKPMLDSQHYRFPKYHDRYSSNKSASWIFSNWDPYFTCPHVRKIGGLGGGSKWICDIERLQKVIERRRQKDLKTLEFWSPPHSHSEIKGPPMQSGRATLCLVYSIGSNGNYIWEDNLFNIIGGDCEIHIFDPDPFDRPGMSKIKNMHFHQWGLGSSYSNRLQSRKLVKRRKQKGFKPVKQVQNRTYYSFQEIRKKLGHENCTIDLFKIDCEGCEWHSYQDWITADLRQILIETHELPTKGNEKRTIFGVLPAVSASAVFDTFHDSGFVLFSKEVNTMNGNGFSSEWSFLKLNLGFNEKGSLGKF
jgi:Methyltransferase domain